MGYSQQSAILSVCTDAVRVSTSMCWSMGKTYGKSPGNRSPSICPKLYRSVSFLGEYDLPQVSDSHHVTQVKAVSPLVGSWSGANSNHMLAGSRLALDWFFVFPVVAVSMFEHD